MENRRRVGKKGAARGGQEKSELEGEGRRRNGKKGRGREWGRGERRQQRQRGCWGTAPEQDAAGTRGAHAPLRSPKPLHVPLAAMEGDSCRSITIAATDSA